MKLACSKETFAPPTALPFNPRTDFAPVSLLGLFDMAVVVPEHSPHKTLADLIAWGRSHPGALNIATIQVGSTQHLAAELFKLRTGTDIVHVPYKGNAPALQDFFVGRVQVMFYPAAGPILNQIKEGTKHTFEIADDRPPARSGELFESSS